VQLTLKGIFVDLREGEIKLDSPVQLILYQLNCRDLLYTQISLRLQIFIWVYAQESPIQNIDVEQVSAQGMHNKSEHERDGRENTTDV
jgi:hypothetical protein